MSRSRRLPPPSWNHRRNYLPLVFWLICTLEEKYSPTLLCCRFRKGRLHTSRVLMRYRNKSRNSSLLHLKCTYGHKINRFIFLKWVDCHLYSLGQITGLFSSSLTGFTYITRFSPSKQCHIRFHFHTLPQTCHSFFQCSYFKQSALWVHHKRKRAWGPV